MFKRLVIATAIFASGPIRADDSLSASANYVRQKNGPDRVELSAIRNWQGPENFRLEAKLRLGTNEKQLQTFDWAGEATYHLIEYVQPALRFYNVSHLANGTHHTGIYPAINFYLPVFSQFRLHANFGWFLRWVSLSTAVPLPYWGGTSYFEHDIGFALGGELKFLPAWRFSATATTYDDFDVHNFNHPILKLTVAHDLADRNEVALFFRNDFLLGFGRTQSWRIGATYVWKFSSPAAFAQNLTGRRLPKP